MQQPKQYIATMFFLQFILFVSTSVSSGFSAASSTVNLAVIEIGKPYGYRNTDGTPSGIYNDITRRIVDVSKIDNTITLLPYKRMINGMEDGTIDCAIFFTSIDRKKQYSQVEMIVKKQVIIITNPFSRPENRITLNNVESFEGKIVGKLRSAHYGERFENNHNIIKKELNDYEDALQMLASGKIDGFIGGKDNIEQFFDHQNHYLLVNTKEAWLQCSKIQPHMNSDIIDQLKSAIQSLIKNNDIINIHRKYIENFQPPR
ncbi:hypothetical protein A9Q99_25825 [Gammaproteobacteria bacterium 45_16_T64]|nr:hypothetical protein A9Q99_25825 [Gammaproteobacteria bacterium 45_16_T64]